MLSPEPTVQFQASEFEVTEEGIQALFPLSESQDPVDLASGSANRPVYSTEERRRRRRISNRESARRSRSRKKRHIENLRKQERRLRLENRELVNRLRLVSHQGLVMQRETDRLLTRHWGLHQKLKCLCQILAPITTTLF